MTSYARNKQASHNYHLHERFEAGIELKGWEVKAIATGKVQLVDTHVIIRRGEAWLINCHVSPGSNVDPARQDDPRRRRRLLLHASEIRKIDGRVKQSGLTVVAVALYRKHGKIKVEISLAKGKKSHDKRQAMRERDWRSNRSR